MPISVFSATDGSYGTISLNGSEKLRLNADGSATVGGVPVQRFLSLGTKVTTSGTTVDFSPADGTGIPSWAKKVTLIYNGVRTNGTAYVSISLGTSAGYVLSGYDGCFAAPVVGQATVGASTTSSFALTANQSTNEFRHGICTFMLASNNRWVMSNTGSVSNQSIANATLSGGSVQLPGNLDRLRVFSLNGTDVFNNGTVSLVVEG